MGLLTEGMKKEARVVEVPGVKYETDLDKIYYEVQRSFNVTLVQLSSKLNIPKHRVEEYAKILDKQGLIKLYYPSIGDLRLLKKEAVVGKKPVKKRKNLLLFTLILIIIIGVLLTFLKLYVMK